MLHDLEKFSLPEVEEQVLKFWKEHQIFEKSLSIRKDIKGSKTKVFRFFEGPPTANGKPGIHHVLARSFKDIVLRYKTMRGYYVPRKAGWDTHGLPVEIAVEKELGIKKKSDIEKFGIAAFNAKAKSSVWQYKSDWEKLTERIGFWLDFSDPYITYDNRYIETLWWIFGEIHKRGLLKKLNKTVPWCPRCETVLSSHELGMPGAYQKTKDPSVYVKFRIKNKEIRSKHEEYLLVWTTTPWTLSANMAVAVNPKLEYTKYRIGDEYLWSATVPPHTQGSEIEVIEKMSGKKLLGTAYVPPFVVRGVAKHPKLHTVLGGDFVSAEEGTGIVHIAPAFGEDDSLLWQKETEGSEALMTIDDHGIVSKGFPGAGMHIKKADIVITAALREKNLLYHEAVIEHEYPFCWRCATPLIYMARSTWFVLMSKLRAELVEANETVKWMPAHIKEGRFGEWIKEAKDWAISRERYWGTPLPIWECEKCEHHVVIPSFKELDRRTTRGNRFFLARHGEADHNVGNYFASGPERGSRISHLTAQGKEQAETMGKELKREGVTRIIVSPYARTRETARIIAKITGAKVSVDARLGELNAGVFNGRSVKEYWSFFENEEERFRKAPPGGENLLDAQKRMCAVFREAQSTYSDTNIAIVSHGDPLYMLEGVMRQIPQHELLALSDLRPGEWREVPFMNLPYTDEGALDVHRPYVDAMTFPCEECKKGTMRRVRGVADVWFDSGAMPYAQWHYPFENKETIDDGTAFPADYIAEGIDQTRGWFYSLLNVALLLKKGPAYKNVISLGLLLDKHGQKMSKSKGNVVDPWEMIAKYGVDTIRWYFFAANDPGESKRFDELDLGKTLRKLFLILYNSFAFYEGYAKLHGAPKEVKAPTHLLDRWIMLRGEEVVRDMTRFLDTYEIGRAARSLEDLVEDMSHWYIRRSRNRFAEGDHDARATLGCVLELISKLMAPFTPFFSEALYLSLARHAQKGERAESVHLADWPNADMRGQTLDTRILKSMARVRTLASKGLAKRAEAKIKVRQPLQSLTVFGESFDDEFVAILKDEVNVKEVHVEASRGDAKEDEVSLDTVITPELREEGMVRDVIRVIQQLRQDAGMKRGEEMSLVIVAPESLRLILERPASAKATAGMEAKSWQDTVSAKEVQYFSPENNVQATGDAMVETKIDEVALKIILIMI